MGVVVTGGAGFIGANLVEALTRRGETVTVVDDFTDGDKQKQIADLSVADCMDKREFLSLIQSRRSSSVSSVSSVLHQGACTDTMATDEAKVMANNLHYSKALYDFCARQNLQFIYASSASVYGGGEVFAESPQNESALNLYARSKLLFDQFVRQQPPPAFQCVGLRYFNVYGRREQHKGTMASVAFHFLHQYRRDGCVKLFAGSGGYDDGEQRRDFVSVDDIVAVNYFFLDNPSLSGIYNAGTGRSRSFNEVALAVINACRHVSHKRPTTLERARADGEIVYIKMPDKLRDKYQSYTQADIKKLRTAGYQKSFADVEQGVGGYVAELLASA